LRSRGLALFLLLAPAAELQAQARCSSEAYRQLDFWVGDWDVRLQDGTLAGRDVVEKSLDGCLVLEHWTDGRQNRGESVFYVHPGTKTWKQVWVTGSGSVKEKQMTAAPQPRAVSFAGESFLPDGTAMPDRTTLIRLANGTVRQIIEQSRDGGKTWQTTFDAVYTLRKPGLRAQ
jgi:hypothetical protein